MNYYVRKLHYITQSIIPVGWLVVVAWLTYSKEADIESLILVGALAFVFAAIFLYSIIKQLKKPLVVINTEGICIHNVWRGVERASWKTITRLRKYPVLGYKLELAGRDIWLPTGMLTGDDAKNLLAEINEQINRKAQQDINEI